MLNGFWNTSLPLIDTIFSIWEITPAMSKLVLLFSALASYLICRVTARSMAVMFPVTFIFLVACAIFVHWILIDVEVQGLNDYKRMMTALLLGESLGGLAVMAFFKTGNRRTAGV
jgi:hypothetical protein